MKVRFYCYENKDLVFKELVSFFIAFHNKSKNKTYVFPGGNTPIQFYTELAGKNIDYQNTKIILSDERIVPLNDERSNEKLMRDNFLSKLVNKSSLPNILDIRNEENLKNCLPELAILGIGLDGHTASLFPNIPETLTHPKNKLTFETKKENEDFNRISLTFNFLLLSRNIVFLVLGENKRKILRTVFADDYRPLSYPAQYLIKNYKGRIKIFCDKAAYMDER